MTLYTNIELQLLKAPHHSNLFYKPLHDIGNCTAMLYRKTGNNYVPLGRVLIKRLFDGSCRDELAKLNS